MGRKSCPLTDATCSYLLLLYLHMYGVAGRERVKVGHSHNRLYDTSWLNMIIIHFESPVCALAPHLFLCRYTVCGIDE